ncbi:MAG: Smr/MutS family protein [Flavobacteriales bacterium]|nr:Smr/MutS family protein [Flavobacteriales bacterium]MBP9078946.1 Smr/MutS family protein [Flavobacteriales bacterium]
MSAQQKLVPGDQFSFLNEVGGGVVLAAVGRDRVKVRTHDGFELVYPVGELVVVQGDPSRSVSDHHAQLRASNDRLAERIEKGKGRGATAVNGGRAHQPVEDPAVMVVDLHLHKLVEDETALNDGEKLSFQLDFFERRLNTAIRERKKRVIVIHGVGEGILREEVRKALQFYEGVRFDDADPRRYGHGATAVEILHY